MIRLIGFLLKCAVLIAAAVWLAENPGVVTVVWQGYEVRMSAAILCVGIFLLIAASLLAYRVLRLLRYGPRGLRSRRQFRRQNLGLQRLEQGFAALAAGDAAAADRMARMARGLLGQDGLPHWLQAQAAQLAGNAALAGQHFAQLAANDRTAMLGYRGLIAAALRGGDLGKASMLVDEMAAQNPKAPWLGVARYELAIRQGAWAQAATALRQAAARQLLDPAAARQQEAALLVAEARTALEKKEPADALQAANKAIGLMPGWLPARITLVQALQASGYGKRAARQAEKFWIDTPHPELGALWRKYYADLSAIKQFKRAEQLAARAPAAYASMVLLAEAALDAELWGEARRQLLRAAESAPTRQVWRLLARLAERDRHDQKAALDYLQRAAVAPAEAAWCCRHCGHSPKQWQIGCPQCGATAAIDWRDPHAAPQAAAMPSIQREL